ncbi:MAG: hypothetical protein O4859_24425 [Trichodesmium sp. St18_bin1]|nr:hypothetical protein [Trichodesmium sp. St18_bin1]MDE5120969.1 hypothetical protein [Trichodesmium sp. St19_bin1]
MSKFFLRKGITPDFECQDMEVAKPDYFKATFPNLWKADKFFLCFKTFSRWGNL